ncbi:MAG: LamG-like jellyroll fold domain-containing protein [Flavobacteriaceae bacterium]
MKNIFKTSMLLFLLLAVFSCDRNNIDPITEVAPGADESAPIVTINRPIEDFKIKVPETLASVTIDFQVSDDIEISTISVALDGTEIATYNDFMDYRNFSKADLVYDSVATGVHTLTVTATDIEGKTTSTSVNFEKTPPYVPIYDGEVFYMPFDGDYTDLISLQAATVEGTPGLAEGKQGQAYLGATDSYLTFPTEGLLDNNAFTASFWYKLGVSDANSGIITIGPGPETNNTNGVKIFRAKSGDDHQMRLLVGSGANGTVRNYNNVIPSTTDWVFVTATVSGTECSVYFNGNLSLTMDLGGEVDWGENPLLSIGSGAPSFSGYGFPSDLNYIDELRFFNKALSQTEITAMVAQNSQVLYMPFDGTYTDEVSGEDATEIGAPGFDTGKQGQAYSGATDSYLTFPSTELAQGSNFSATFWLKIDGSDTRAGIINIAPAEPANDPSQKSSGFGLIREGSDTAQKFVLLVGNGTNSTWVNPGTPATIDPTLNEWVHFGITISESTASLYMNGELVGQGDFPGIDWTEVGDLSIMSGDPNFSGWNHKTEKGLMDELRIFNETLTQEQIQALMN